MVILGVEGGEHRLRVHQDTSEGTIAAASRTKALQAIRSSPLYLMRVRNSRALVLRLQYARPTSSRILSACSPGSTFGGVVGHNMAAALASRAVRAGSGRVNVDVRCQLEWSRKRRGRDRGPGIRHQEAEAEAGAQAECRSVRKGLRIRPRAGPRRAKLVAPPSPALVLRPEPQDEHHVLARGSAVRKIATSR